MCPEILQWPAKYSYGDDLIDSEIVKVDNPTRMAMREVPKVYGVKPAAIAGDKLLQVVHLAQEEAESSYLMRVTDQQAGLMALESHTRKKPNDKSMD